MSALLRALAEFKGVGRRFQRYGDHALATGGVVTVVDDYGHHPVEMQATLAAARGAFPGPSAGAGVSTTPLHPHP
jgi:UDP-N-acetylmuramate--alanine ligase